MRFVCSLWHGRDFWRPVAKYGPHHVEVLASMLARHGGHSLTCVHDGSFDLPRHIDAVRMPEAVAAMPDYLPKLWLWSPELHETIGERFAAIDLDVVLLDDVAPLLTGPGIRIWNEAVGEPYNTSLFALDPCDGRDVWDRYSPAAERSAREHATRWTGDQSWVAHILGRGLPTFGECDGIVRYRRGRHIGGPPPGTKAVFLCGPMCPETESRDATWISDNWR